MAGEKLEYWHDILTEKSWSVLQKLKKQRLKFILIGGWAVYLWTRAFKSRDIDVIIGFEGLDQLKQKYNIRKNPRLKKYEAKTEDVDIDIYVPFYSELPIPIQDITETEHYTTVIEGFEVATPEILLILKQRAIEERGDTEKGLKDQIDILVLLLKAGINFGLYKKLLKKYRLKPYLAGLKKMINSFREIKYLDLNPRQFKKKKQELLEKLR